MRMTMADDEDIRWNRKSLEQQRKERLLALEHRIVERAKRIEREQTELRKDIESAQNLRKLLRK